MPEHDAAFFASTRWTIVCDAASGGDAVATEALGALFRTYWQPLYRYARRRGKSKEDAEDLVQGFFGHLLEARALRDTSRDKGRFRAFLLASFNHWMINTWKRETRLKRGRGIPALSFDWEEAESGLKLEPADDRSPDRLFDREWALTLLGKVLDDLEAASRDEGDLRFDRLKPCLTADSSRIPYASLAADLEMSEGALRVAVHRLRKRYRALLTEEIARTLSSPEAVEDEMQALFAVLAG
ncbi:sigma-70 family RNA polymerase sigma factor [Luteolibacter arcticus]|uniref:Sigma-70 family RNA polymerase sigma factor n=1 Tax=Luteolibacter arcticus TaxID=1581411 RepID=A0ABT3GIB5_9BACT|nr:sigma-70 family RNA polymerase sigma factor [Luteolibacter arcticus]MCW1923241.1 sigma-70 family RNA polymerase sigma factor [Luteolibacter arcticus]